jgi:membrane protein
MVWLYYNWIILLLGSKISFYHQYPDLLALKDERLLSSDRLREKVALTIMYLIGYGYYHNNQRWTMGTLVKHLRLPLKYIQDTLEALSDHGMLLMVSEDMSYLPAMDLEKISLNHILAAVRIETGERNGILKRIEELSEIDAIMARIDEAGYRSVENETLKDLVIRGIHRQ